jgi:hypothetical protein
LILQVTKLRQKTRRRNVEEEEEEGVISAEDFENAVGKQSGHVPNRREWRMHANSIYAMWTMLLHASSNGS